MDVDFKRIVQKADKFAREKDYRCLYPGCARKAIRSHSIPRATCLEALATNGELYTLRMSLNPIMSMSTPFDPLEVVKVGVNDAGVFKGYCPVHDNCLFRAAETTDRQRKNSMVVSLHLRALSLEYCRKRYVLEFLKQLVRLTKCPSTRSLWQEEVESRELLLSCLGEAYLGSIFNRLEGSDIESVEYYLVPFSRNLQVSCCGCFDGEPGVFDSTIAFNLIAYSDMSILVLTNFTTGKHYLEACIKDYKLPTHGERLINDIAFLHCEEPLISTRFWLSLSESDKLSIRLSLRHPSVRTETTAPRIIKLVASDFVKQFTPEMLRRLPPNCGNSP